MPTGTPPPMSHVQRDGHLQRAEVAYAAYVKVQARIERHEKYAQEMYPDNDRQMAWWLTNNDSDDAWRYRMLCSQRGAYQTIIAVETAMASLYS